MKRLILSAFSVLLAAGAVAPTAQALPKIDSAFNVQKLRLSELDARNKAEETSTYATCYFRNGVSETWHWGLQPNDDWYEMAGTWETRRHLGTSYFSPSTATEAEILQSCRASQAYYEVSGDLIGVYSANSATGSNYEIRLDAANRIDGVEVLP